MHTKAPSIKIIAIDYYQSPPHPLTDRCQSQFSSRPLSSVPVVRIFGSVFPSEQRACLHVHQCFPYIYVPYEGDLNASKAEAYIRKLAASINGAMQIAVSKIANQRHHQSPAGEFVVGITLVQGTPFYGFHSKPAYFLKIYHSNPDQTHLLVDILASGGVMGKPLQAHESHINYIMQFFMDYNLYGMDYIHLKSCRFRSPLPQPARALGNATMASPYGLLEPSQFWTSASVPTDWIWPERYRISKQSFCDLELDATVMDIENRSLVPERPLASVPKIAPEDIPASNETKFVPSLMRIWQDEVDRRIASSRSSKILTPPSQNTKRTPGTVWYNADELRLKFEAAIHQAREHQRNALLARQPLVSAEQRSKRPDSRVGAVSGNVPTAFSAVESLLSAHLRRRESHLETTFDVPQRKGGAEQRNDQQFAAVSSIFDDTSSGQVQQRLVDDRAPSEVSDASYDDIIVSQVALSQVPLGVAGQELDPEIANDRMSVEYERVCASEDDDSDDDSDGQSDFRLNPPGSNTTETEGILDWLANNERSTGHQSPPTKLQPKRKLQTPSPLQQEVRGAMLASPGPSQSKKHRLACGPLETLDPALKTDELPPPTSLDSENDDDWAIESTCSTKLPSFFGRISDGMWSPPPIEREQGLDDMLFFNDPPRPLSPSEALFALEPTTRFLASSVVPEAQRIESSPGMPKHVRYTGGQTPDPAPSLRMAPALQQHAPALRQYVRIDSPRTTVEPTDTRNIREAISRSDPRSRTQTSDPPKLPPTTIDLETLGSSSTAERRHRHLGGKVLVFNKRPPSAEDLLSSLESLGLPRRIYNAPFFSRKSDSDNERTVLRSYGGIPIEHGPSHVGQLKEFHDQLPGAASCFNGLEYWRANKWIDYHHRDNSSSTRTWTIGKAPPTRRVVQEWLRNQAEVKALKAARKPSHKIYERTSQQPISTGTTRATLCSPQARPKSTTLEAELCLFSLEIHVSCTAPRLPDPQNDPVVCAVYCIQDHPHLRYPSNGRKLGYHVGLAAIQDHIDIAKTGVKGYAVHSVPSEKELIEFVIKIVRESDPDILLGFEIHMASWGYLAERAVIYHIDLCQELARVATLAKSKFGRDQDQWGFKKQSSLSSTGRIFLNVWRLFRAEVDLRSYTVEHLVYHTLRKRIPKMSNSALSEWYHHGPLKRWRTLRYYIDRAQYNLELLDAIELIGRTSEFARVFGIDFFSVLSRGSQFKVESILTRIIKPENYIMISPSRGQVARMRVYECIPLVMEPESGFYSSPVLVLDFQSLYPSVMIAYNYCYSTCLGRVESAGTPHKLGVSEQYFAPPDVLSELQDHINISPNGLAFVKPYVREGALRKMLTEILETRVMVKESMKSYSDKSLLKLLEARQLGLKFIANVTYGYTGATYSGRMPCVEIADAIVQTGRVTLERAISLINKTKKWGAQVVYGDTDSLFVHLPGQTRERAFDIGKEICEAVTNSNPHPIKLKFEKVFHPCMLLTKKRYVGFKFESKSDTKPVFDAKGIETVRRDGCPAVGNMVESCLRLFFRTQDLSALKSYLETEWSSILAGDVLIQDFIIAKEVKLGRYSENATLPAGAALSTRKMQRDHRSEPQYGERVPYLVAYGPGTRLVDLVIEPQELVSNRSLRLNGLYYITKQINPALSRIFNLVGADIQKWFADMPRVQRATEFTLSQMSRANSRITIDQYYSSKHCHVCGQISGSGLCVSCKQDPIKTAVVLQQRISDQTRAHLSHQRACRMCAGYEELDLQSGDAAPCISIDCKLYYGRKVAKNNMRLSQKLQRLLQEKK